MKPQAARITHVLSEWTALPANRPEVLQLIRQIRAKAFTYPGYTLGLVWQDEEDPNRFLSNDAWRGIERWHQFQADPTVRALTQQLDKVVRGPAVVRVYTEATDEDLISSSTDRGVP